MAARDAITSLLMGWRLNQGLLIRSQITPDFRIEHIFPIDMGVDGFITIARYYQTAFPGWNLDYTYLSENGDQIDILVHMSGTHLGTYPNLLPGRPAIPATGRTFVVNDIPISVFMRNTKIARCLGNERTRQKADQIFAQLVTPLTSKEVR